MFVTVHALWLICRSHCDALKWACRFRFGPFQTKPHRICVCSCVWETAIRGVNARQWMTFIWFEHITFKHTSPQSFVFILATSSSNKHVSDYVSWWFTRQKSELLIKFTVILLRCYSFSKLPPYPAGMLPLFIVAPFRCKSCIHQSNCSDFLPNPAWWHIM